MKINSFKSMNMHLFYTPILLSILLIGCSDSTQNDKKQQKEDLASIKTDASQKIEVVKNENALEIKVAKKESDGNQSKSYYYDYNVNSNYDLNSRPANGDASVREKPTFITFSISKLAKFRFETNLSNCFCLISS